MKVVAVSGTYRHGRTIDTAVDEALRGAREAGAETEKIFLLDKHIEFCTNCRACTQESGPTRGRCPIRDDMEDILIALDSADAYIVACPINYYSVTAVMKRFIERLICYGYWPWGAMPKMRIKTGHKKALLITASACPAFIGRIAFRSVFGVLNAAAQSLGAKTIGKLYFGTAAAAPDSTLGDKDKQKAFRAGRKLIG